MEIEGIEPSSHTPKAHMLTITPYLQKKLKKNTTPMEMQYYQYVNLLNQL